MSSLPIQPRILRAHQAHRYLGMCRDVFNKTVRPHVREFPIGQQGIGFDRIELDQWADAYIASHSVEKLLQRESLLRPENPFPQTKAPFSALAQRSQTEHELEISVKAFHEALEMVTGKPATKCRGRKQSSPRQKA